MRILFLDHPQHTHGTWLLYEGLQRVLSQEVVDFPFKKTYHGDNHNLNDTKWYRDVYEDIREGYDLPIGIPPLSPGESLTTGDERTMTLKMFPSAYHTHTFPQEHTEEEVIDMIGSYDFIVLGNSHRVPTIALARLRDRCARLPPIVYYDAGERDEFNAHWAHLFRPALTFKQILTPEVEGAYRGPYVDLRVPVELYPLPLSCPFAHGGPPFVQLFANATIFRRPLDVVSHFGPTWETRARVQERVRAVVQKLDASSVLRGIISDPETGFPYFAGLAMARVAVSMRGSGRDTDRYWQVPALGAALLCDGTMGCVHPYPFRDNATAYFYRTLDELEEKLTAALGDEDARSAIAGAGRSHLRQYHSVEARALYFLGIVRRAIGFTYTPAQEERTSFWRRKLEWSSELPEWRGEVIGFKE